MTTEQKQPLHQNLEPSRRQVSVVTTSTLPGGAEAVPDSGLEVRQSALNDFELCGEMFRRKHLEHESVLPGMALLRGVAVHVAAQRNHEQKRTTDKDLKKNEIVDVGVTAFRTRKSDSGFRLTASERRIGLETTLARTISSVIALSATYADRVAPRMHPDLIEHATELPLPGGITFRGRLDLSTREGRIVDLKTSARMKSQKDADESIQASMYWLLYRRAKGEEAKGFDFEVLIDAKNPRAQTVSTMRTAADIAVLVARANAMLRATKAGVFAPAQVGAWICSEKWCPFWPTCSYVNAERSAVSDTNE